MHKIKLCGIDVCTQCYACVTRCPVGCIQMVDTKDGFKLPQVDEINCLKCGICQSSCHRLTSDIEFKKPQKALSCWTKRLEDRKRSSSGGAFSVLARRVMSLGGVVFGASMSRDLKVRHISIESEEDLIQLQGSKYLQSYLGDTYKRVELALRSNRLVLFSGTPCQVGGLLTFLKKKYENLLTCDVVCHGVPAQKAFDTYINRIGVNKKCENFHFRFTEGWGFQLSQQMGSRKIIINPTKAYYLRAFTSGLMFSESCYNCAYARIERVSDFTLADYWGLGTIVPFNHSTHKGVSLLLLNSDKAASFIGGCSDLFFEERPLEESIEGNHNLSHPSVRPQGRDTYLSDAESLSTTKLCKKYGITAGPRDYLRLIKQFINSFR